MGPGEGARVSVYDDRRVKIVATLGPASSAPETLRAMMEAGLDVCRINTAQAPWTSAPS